MPKHDLALEPPVMNAAGSLGFYPNPHSPVDWSRFGAFVTNPVSLLPRTPARGGRFGTYPGGFLLHTGYPNPGLSQLVRRYAGQWSRSPLPVIVHLLAHSAEEVATMARRLELLEGISGLEIGLPGGATLEMVKSLIQAAAGELPVIARLPIERALELAPGALDSGAEAISLAPPRGAFQDPKGVQAQGRMYGPSIYPLSLRMVRELTQSAVPTIAAGGITTRDAIQNMLAAGAMAVQLDSILWRTAGYNLFTEGRSYGNIQN